MTFFIVNFFKLLTNYNLQQINTIFYEVKLIDNITIINILIINPEKKII